MTVIVTLIGHIFCAIWGKITRYWAVSGDIGAIWKDIGVVSCSVKFVMYWARPIQVVVPGQLFFLVYFVWPCRICYVAILLKTAFIGQYC